MRYSVAKKKRALEPSSVRVPATSVAKKKPLNWGDVSKWWTGGDSVSLRETTAPR